VWDTASKRVEHPLPKRATVKKGDLWCHFKWHWFIRHRRATL